MINNIKGILFDMDGTVLDSEGLFDESQLLLLKEYSINASICDLEEFKGMSYKDFYPLFMKKFNIDSDIDTIRLKLRTYLHQSMKNNLKFIDGFEYFYNSFIKDNELKVGLVTNTTRLTYEKIRTYINIDDYFSFVLTVNESKKPKPSPIPYIQAMDSLSLDVKETLIIEDSKTGLESAIKSKAKVIGITTSLTDSQIKNIDNNIIVAKSYSDIGMLLKS
ncbi:MAG: hypothetical protein CMF82_02605 [Candidatus Marinimicrobia bacterium]|nr:hypothetical protein [Candidatus Neomarinimicrobiota bacterium]|tara:strand:- start:4189 stop:4848 length:660 start_codon:yes stop_codon:yes gene_type:complete